jgi:hypothetical protein
MKPPIINDAPSGINSTAAASPIALCMFMLSFCFRGRAISRKRPARAPEARRTDWIRVGELLPPREVIPYRSVRAFDLN